MAERKYIHGLTLHQDARGMILDIGQMEIWDGADLSLIRDTLISMIRGEGHQAIIRPMDEVRPLFARNIALPFIEAVGRNEAAAAADGIAETGFLQHGLAAGIDERLSGCHLLGPGRHEAPAHQREMPLRPALPDDGHGSAGRDMVPGRKLRHFKIVEKAARLFRRTPETVKSAHDARP